MVTNTDRRVRRFLSDFRTNNSGIMSLAVFSDLGVVISEGSDFNRNEFHIAQISSILLSTTSKIEVEEKLGEITSSITTGEDGTIILYAVPKNYSIFLRMKPNFGDLNFLLYRLKVLALKLKHVFEQQKIVDPIEEGDNDTKSIEFTDDDGEILIASAEHNIEDSGEISRLKMEKIDEKLEKAKQDVMDLMDEKITEKVNEEVYEVMKLRVENALLKDKLRENCEPIEGQDPIEIINIQEKLHEYLDKSKNELLEFVKNMIVKQ